MKAFKILLLAGIVSVPLAVSAQAADIGDPVSAESEAMGLYLRGDAGISFLQWSGGDDDTGMNGGAAGDHFADDRATFPHQRATNSNHITPSRTAIHNCQNRHPQR